MAGRRASTFLVVVRRRRLGRACTIEGPRDSWGVECLDQGGGESRLSGWGARPSNGIALRNCGARSRPVSLSIAIVFEALNVLVVYLFVCLDSSGARAPDSQRVLRLVGRSFSQLGVLPRNAEHHCATHPFRTSGLAGLHEGGIHHLCSCWPLVRSPKSPWLRWCSGKRQSSQFPPTAICSAPHACRLVQQSSVRAVCPSRASSQLLLRGFVVTAFTVSPFPMLDAHALRSENPASESGRGENESRCSPSGDKASI